MNKNHPDVEGYCPMGCGRTLFVGSGGFITCSYVHCPRPDAVYELLAVDQPEHIVVFAETAITVKHPLRERLDDALLTCRLHTYCADLPGPPAQLGTYRATAEDGRWRFARLDSA